LNVRKAPNRWRDKIPGAREVTIEAGKNLSYSITSFSVRAGEPIKLTFVNPDVVPHNWALIRPGTLPSVGSLVNKIIAEPDAAARHYIPRTEDVLAYVDIVDPGRDFTIYFRAPSQKGRYPYLCTFPGHWMVMNGVMTVE
jgi:azurin